MKDYKKATDRDHTTHATSYLLDGILVLLEYRVYVCKRGILGSATGV